MSFKSLLTKLNRRDTRILPKFSKTAEFILISLITLTVSIFALHALAQTNILQENIDAWSAPTGNFNKLTGPSNTEIQVTNGLQTLFDIKDAPPAIIKGLTSDGKVPFWVPGGLSGTASNTIASIYSNPPASGIQYFAQMKDNFLGIPAAYAQGVGFQGLQPLLPVWRAFRNVVYILSSLIFIVIGIMIMLRVKISPQAVINVQNAIPKLITALILVTFSYAIAGLIIDLMYVVQSVVLATVFTGLGKSLATSLLNPSTPNVSTSFANLSNFNWGSVFFLSIKNIPILVFSSIGAIIGAIVGFFVGIPVPVVGNVIGAIAGAGIGGLLFALIVGIMVLFLVVKFLFGLLKCYVTLIFKIVIAPLEIGMGAFPNSKLGFGSWIMDVLANIAVFPVSLIFLVLVNVISESSAGPPTLWSPSIINFGGLTSGAVPALIALAGLMLLAKLPEMIPEFIFMIKPSPWGQAIGENMKPENLPLIGGAIGDFKAARSKARGEKYIGDASAVVDYGKSKLPWTAKQAGNDQQTQIRLKEVAKPKP